MSVDKQRKMAAYVQQRIEAKFKERQMKAKINEPKKPTN